MNANHVGSGQADSVAEILGLKSQFDVFRFLKRTTELFGFEYFTVMRMPESTSLDLSDNSIITNWPADSLNRFDRMKLLRSSPLIARMRNSVLPMNYSYKEIIEARSGEDAEKAGDVYGQFALWNGVCIPVHDPQGERAAILMAGDREVLDHGELSELTFLAIHIYQRLSDVTRSDTKPEQSLTQRELDCLTWTAAGKTSADIAQILELSEHTVNHYLNRAARKLDTVNRTQAVAKALRRGLIH